MSAPFLAAGPDTPKNDVGELVREIQDLQRRVLALEERLGNSPVPAASPRKPAVAPSVARAGPAERPLPTNTLPVVGKVLVAIAGAYVLRTLTDFGVMPRPIGVTVGLLYALLWLFIAARPRLVGTLPIALTCATSMLVLDPLMWEASQRQKVMSSGASAAVLTSFALIALRLSWPRRQVLISGIVSVSTIAMAAVLLVATRDVFPFTLALVTIAAATEFAACCGRQTGSRALSALAADCAVLLFSWLMSRPAGLPEGYAPTSVRAVLEAQLLLILVYIAMAVTQTVLRRRTLTLFETMQTACALLVGMGGIVWVFNNNRAAMLALGISGLVGGLACYIMSFLLFDRASKWNFRAWATFGMFLVLAGTFLPFSGSGFWLLWSGCAIASCWVARIARRPTLGLHGAVYLTLAAGVSGAMAQPLWELFGTGSGSYQWLVSTGVLAAATASWVAIVMSSPGQVAFWRKQVASLVISANIAWILCGIAAHSLTSVWRSAEGWVGRIPADTLGTIVISIFSVVLAWSSTHWLRRELAWLAYGFMGLGAWKLATRDFVHERDLTLVTSLVFYGCALILLPRMLRTRNVEEGVERSTA